MNKDLCFILTSNTTNREVIRINNKIKSGATVSLYSAANLLCDAVTERIAAGQDISELETDAQVLLDHYGMDNYGTLAITVLSAYIDDYERMAMVDEAVMAEAMAEE